MFHLACACVAYLTQRAARERRLRVVVAGNKDPCFSSQTQPRKETGKQPLKPGSWGDIIDVESPEDDEDEELSPHLLEGCCHAPNSSHPHSNHSGDPPSSPVVELDLMEACRRVEA